MNLRLTGTIEARIWGLGAFALICVLASTALAQGGEKGNTPEYRQLVDQAVEEFQRGNWDEASGLFEQAHQLNPNARTLRGMGLSAFEGRRYVAALKHLQAAMTERVNALTDTQRGEVQATIDRAGRYVANLALTVEPANAEVTINGLPIAHSGVETIVMLDPGIAEVRATAIGMQVETRQLRMVSGVQQSLSLRLTPVGSTPPPPGGFGGTTPPPPAASSSTSSLSVWKWVTAGAAVVGFGVAIPALIVSASKADDWNNDPECKQYADPELAEGVCGDRRDDFQRMETVGTVALIAGGVFAATSITLFVIDGLSDDGPSAQSAGTTSCGVGLLAAQCRVAF
jgi:hypothetical protein